MLSKYLQEYQLDREYKYASHTHARARAHACTHAHTHLRMHIKMSGNESRRQEEAASTHVFRPMQPLQ